MPKRPHNTKAKAKKRKRSAKLSPYVVFLSHSSSDSWIARLMAEKIEELGARCWLDEKDLEGGDIIAEDIIRGIKACKEAIVLVSPNSVKSQWVMFEIGGVRALHKRVTPVLNNVSLEKLVPIKDIKGIDLNKFDQFLEQLKRRIKIKRKARSKR